MAARLRVHPPPSGLRPQPSDKLARLPDPPRESEAMQQIPLILFTIKDLFEARAEAEAELARLRERIGEG